VTPIDDRPRREKVQEDQGKGRSRSGDSGLVRASLLSGRAALDCGGGTEAVETACERARQACEQRARMGWLGTRPQGLRRTAWTSGRLACAGGGRGTGAWPCRACWQAAAARLGAVYGPVRGRRTHSAERIHNDNSTAPVHRSNARTARGQRCPGARTTLWIAKQRRR
jgi:hypothetical protein